MRSDKIYLVTSCAACAAPLSNKALQCKRCKTRYCSEACQSEDSRRGHKQNCKLIKRAGGAEQDYADKKYAEAVAEAVEACADDTKGATCYVCLEGAEKEGLVRGCACHGTEGFAHVSCLARQAQILIEGDLETMNKPRQSTWGHWNECSLCNHLFHGVVHHALGWACWKAYVSSPPGDEHDRLALRCGALRILGSGLTCTERHKDALAVYEAELATLRCFQIKDEATDVDFVALRGNKAVLLANLGRHEEALRLRREVYAKTLDRYGPSHQVTLQTAEHLSQSLFYTSKLAEAKDFLLESIPKAQASLGDDKFYTLRLRSTYGKVLRKLGSVGEAEATLTDILRRGRRTLGDSHPFVQDVAHELDELRTGRSDSSEQAALAALAFVAALAFLAGRRYLRR